MVFPSRVVILVMLVHLENFSRCCLVTPPSRATANRVACKQPYAGINFNDADAEASYEVPSTSKAGTHLHTLPTYSTYNFTAGFIY